MEATCVLRSACLLLLVAAGGVAATEKESRSRSQMHLGAELFEGGINSPIVQIFGGDRFVEEANILQARSEGVAYVPAQPRFSKAAVANSAAVGASTKARSNLRRFGPLKGVVDTIGTAVTGFIKCKVINATPPPQPNTSHAGGTDNRTSPLPTRAEKCLHCQPFRLPN